MLLSSAIYEISRWLFVHRVANPGSFHREGRPQRGDELWEARDVVAVDDPGTVQPLLANALEDGDAHRLAVGKDLFLDLGDAGPGNHFRLAATLGTRDAFGVQAYREGRRRDHHQVAHEAADEDNADQRADHHAGAF